MHKKIKELHKKARVERVSNLSGIYSNLLAKIELETKRTKRVILEDKDVITIINYWVKQMEGLMKVYKGKNLEKYQEAEEELLIYQALLPTPLTEEELREIIVSNSLSTIPKLMKYLSEHYLGRYKAQEAIKILNTTKVG